MEKNKPVVDYDPSWTAICTGNTQNLLDPDAFTGKVDLRNPDDIQKPTIPGVHGFLSEAAWLDESIK